MQIIGILITIFFLIWFRSRFLSQIFSKIPEIKLKKFLIRGAILVALLFMYEQLFSIFGWDKEHYFIREIISLESVTGFIGYGLLVVCAITLIFRNFNKKKIWLQIIIGLFSMIIITFWGIKIGLASLMIYYALSAFTEEIFKFTLGNNQSESEENHSSSGLLLFTLLIGFSFSIAENILALGVQFFHGEALSSGTLLGRGLIAALVHCVATGLIALILMKMKMGKR